MHRCALLAVTCAVVVTTGGGACEGDRPVPRLTRGYEVSDHEASFPIGEGAIHALGTDSALGAISCDSCHAGTESFAQATCINCHGQDDPPLAQTHEDTPGYVEEDASCLTCHATGYAYSFEAHTLNEFPIGPDTAHGGPAYVARVPRGALDCNACHASREDRRLLRCAECHEQDMSPPSVIHQAFSTSFQAEACIACHAETPAYTLEEHNTNEHGVSIPHRGVMACRACHVSNQGEPRPWAIDFNTPMPYSTPTCVGCHGDEVVPTEGHPQGGFPIGAGSPHGGSAYRARLAEGQGECAGCHASTDDRSLVRCAQCHASDTRPLSVVHQTFKDSFDAESCQACHRSATTFPIASHLMRRQLPHPGATSCRSCHSRTAATPNAWAIDFAFARPFESAACVDCHGPGASHGNSVHGATDFPVGPTESHGGVTYNGLRPPGTNVCTACHTSVDRSDTFRCADCHAAQATDLATTHSALPDSFDANTCEACHASLPPLTVSEHAAQLPLPHEGATECSACHTSAAAPPRSWAIDFSATAGFTGPSCASCHPGGLVMTTADHTRDVFAISSTDVHGDEAYLARIGAGENRCTSCHVDVADPDQLRCASCHASDTPSTAQTHAAFAASFAANTCQACHANLPPLALAAHEPTLPHEGILDCRTCHTATAEAPRTWAIDFAAEVPFTGPACASCHPGGLVQDTATHTSDIFAISSTDLHGDAAYLARMAPGENRCSSCHTGSAGSPDVKCASCHDADTPPTATSHNAFTASFNAETCQGCHATTPAFDMSGHDALLDLPHFGVSACASCHVTRLPEPRAWALDFKGAMPLESLACVSCHRNGNNCNPATPSLCGAN